MDSHPLSLVHSRTRTTAPRAPARSAAVAVLHRCPQEDARPCVHSLSLAHAGSQPRTSAITHISAPKRMRTAVPSCALCTCPRAPVLARACAQRSRDMVAGPLSRSLWRLCAITRACVGPPPPPLAGPSGFRVRPPASAAPAELPQIFPCSGPFGRFSAPESYLRVSYPWVSLQPFSFPSGFPSQTPTPPSNFFPPYLP